MKKVVPFIKARETSLHGSGGDVVRELPRLRECLDREIYQRLLPGYVRHYFERAAPLVGVEITGDPDSCFSLRSADGAGADPLLHVLETYPPRRRNCLSFVRPKEHEAGVWIHPAYRGSHHR